MENMSLLCGRKMEGSIRILITANSSYLPETVLTAPFL